MNELGIVRRELGWTQARTAEFMCLNYDTYRHLEASKRPVRKVYVRMLEMMLILKTEGLLPNMPISPTRFHIRMTSSSKFAIYDAFARIDVGEFVEYTDADEFRSLLIKREENRLTMISEMAMVNSTTQENSS